MDLRQVRDFKGTRQHDRYINILLSHMIVTSLEDFLPALHIRDESLHYAPRLVRACDLSNKRHRDDHDKRRYHLGARQSQFPMINHHQDQQDGTLIPRTPTERPRGLRKADRNGAARIRSARASERTSSLPI